MRKSYRHKKRGIFMSKKRSFRGAFFMLCKIVSKYPSVFSPKFKAPAESPMRRFLASFFYAGILPGYAYRTAIRTRCTLARLAVMRIPQSHQCDAFKRRFFTPGSSPGTRIALRSAPAARSHFVFSPSDIELPLRLLRAIIGKDRRSLCR